MATAKRQAPEPPPMPLAHCVPDSLLPGGSVAPLKNTTQGKYLVCLTADTPLVGSCLHTSCLQAWDMSLQVSDLTSAMTPQCNTDQQKDNFHTKLRPTCLHVHMFTLLNSFKILQ